MKVIQYFQVYAFAILTLGSLSRDALADLTITNTTDTASIKNQLTGKNVTISNVTFNQGNVVDQTGIFSGGSTGGAGPLLSIENGVVLVTGTVTTADGPNNFSSKTTGGEEGPHDASLATVDNGTQYDTIAMQFDVVPNSNTLGIDFVFASEEYNEFVCTIFNDAMGIFVSGPGIVGEVNIARLDQNLANFSINEINRGVGGAAQIDAPAPCNLNNSQFYINNISNYDESVGTTDDPTLPSVQSSFTNLEYDGFTKPLTATVQVEPNQTYTVKVVTADIGDASWDGAVFLDLVSSYNLDYGDAPNSYGTSSVNQAIQLPGPARHSIDLNPSVYLGSVVPDPEGNGTPATSPNPADGDDNTGDDEDAFNSTLTISSGTTSHVISDIPVHNTSTQTAKLMGWIDFNQDGDFLDAGEQATVNVAPNQTAANLSWSGFSSTSVGNTYARFRITTDANLINLPSPVGLAMDGEVEDYQVAIAQPLDSLDYGDAPDTYGTDQTAGNSSNTSDPVGASHAVTPNLFLGATVPDLDVNGFVDGTDNNNIATDDDDPVGTGTGNGDDEDNFTLPTLSTGTNSYTIPRANIKVTNTTRQAATLHAWIDFDKNGKFDPAEYASTPVNSGTKGGNPTANLAWTGINVGAVGNTYARFRLTTDSSITKATPGGAANNGEVEDYQMAIANPISPLAGQLVINEVLYAQTGGNNSTTGNDEFIEIFNPSNNTIDLSGFKLMDGNLLVSATTDPKALDGSSGSITGNQLPYVFTNGTSLKPGEYAVIWIGDKISGRSAVGAAFETWLGNAPKLNNIGDDVWLYDANTKVIDYMAYGLESSGAINTRLDSSLNLWNSTYENKLDNPTPGQSISLTPNGIDGNASACWEKTAILTSDPDTAKGRCTGFLNTIDTDIAFITPNQRITSVGKNNNQIILDYGDALASYEGSDAARHGIISSLHLGNVFPDAEAAAQSSANADGDDAVATPNIDDEEGISSFPTLKTNTTSYTLTAKVDNPGDIPANVYAWIDFDRDGKFDGDERAIVSNGSITLDSNGKVPTGSNGTVTLTWNNIGGTGADITNGNSYARIRLTTNNLSTASATNTRDPASIGIVSDGEIEDYQIAIAQALDYGDAPDTYGTDKTANNSSNTNDPIGASHALTPNLFLGATRPDNDANGFVDGTDNNNNATDDDDPVGTGTGNGDDEDNFAVPTLIAGSTSYTIPMVNIMATNTTGQAATLHAWIDFNKNGKFDSTEYASTPVNSGTNGGNPTAGLTWNGINVGAVGNTYARFRLTTDSSITNATPGGAANNGEVEDYQMAIAPKNPDLSTDFCQTTRNILFILDDSSSVTATEVQQQRDAVMATLNSFLAKGIARQAAIVGFDSVSRTVINYTDITTANLSTFQTALNNNYGVPGTGTNWEAGFQAGLALGVNKPNVVFFFTDGTKNAGGSPDDEAAQFKNAGVHIYGIGIDGLTIDSGFKPITDGNNSVTYNGSNIFETDYVDIDNYSTLQNQYTNAFLANLCPADFGDAPDTYGTDNIANNSTNSSEPLGANHFIVTGLFLGTKAPDADANGFVNGTDNNNNAADDDAPIGTGNGNDEGNFTLPNLRAGATSYKIPASNITVTNTITPSATATLHAWIDFDKNGKFDSTEYASVPVNSGTNGGNPTANLTWNGINVGAVGNAYARFRLTTDSSITNTTPGGIANNGEVEDYQITIKLGSKLMLLKRITAINPGQSGEIQFSNFVDDLNTSNDNEPKWPDSDPNPNNTTNDFLRGAINVPNVKPGDEVEYTIYFLSYGDADAKNIKICDAVPDDMTFTKQSYGKEVGISLASNATKLPTTPNKNLSNLIDSDQGSFYAPGTNPPVNLCKKHDPNPPNNLIPVNGSNNLSGAVFIELSNPIPAATSSGTPPNSYGFIRFRAKVK